MCVPSTIPSRVATGPLNRALSFSDQAEQLRTRLTSVRELVVSIGAPRRDYRKHEDPAVAKEEWIGECMVVADFVGRMGDVELDGL